MGSARRRIPFAAAGTWPSPRRLLLALRKVHFGEWTYVEPRSDVSRRSSAKPDVAFCVVAPPRAPDVPPPESWNHETPATATGRN